MLCWFKRIDLDQVIGTQTRSNEPSLTQLSHQY
jgi:hypothetical protein